MHSNFISLLPLATIFMAGITTATPFQNERWIQARSYDAGEVVNRRELSRNIFEGRDVQYDNVITTRDLNDAALRLREMVDHILESRAGDVVIVFTGDCAGGEKCGGVDKSQISTLVKGYYKEHTADVGKFGYAKIMTVALNSVKVNFYEEKGTSKEVNIPWPKMQPSSTGPPVPPSKEKSRRSDYY